MKPLNGVDRGGAAAYKTIELTAPSIPLYFCKKKPTVFHLEALPVLLTIVTSYAGFSFNSPSTLSENKYYILGRFMMNL